MSLAITWRADRPVIDPFKIGTERMPRELIRAFGILKKAALTVDLKLISAKRRV